MPGPGSLSPRRESALGQNKGQQGFAGNAIHRQPISPLVRLNGRASSRTDDSVDGAWRVAKHGKLLLHRGDVGAGHALRQGHVSCAPSGVRKIGLRSNFVEQIDRLDMTMLEAVSAPRITANSNTIDVSNRIPKFVTNKLVTRGYPVSRSPFSYVFSGVHAIRIVDGRWDGGADPGRDGMALVV